MANNTFTYTILPKKIASKALIFYLMALIGVLALYSQYPLPWYYQFSGIFAVAVFFFGSQSLSKRWSTLYVHSNKSFEKKIFWIAFFLRLAWVFCIYAINMNVYGDAYGFENMDALLYHQFGQYMAGRMRVGDFHLYDNAMAFLGRGGIDDMGQGTYMGLVYLLTNDSIIVARILKCVWSALTCVLVYRLAKRNFGMDTARLAAIFCVLWPNFWYYCGCHLKEVEMVFLATLFVEQADDMLKTRNFSAWKVVPVLLISGALFTYRTVLALVTVLSLLFSAVMSSTKVVSWGKRIIIGFLAAILIGVTMGNRIQEEAQGLVSKVQSDQQKENMEWRSKRLDAGKNVNKFAKYATAAIFAPMIFSIPYPTMVSPYEGQNVQKLLHGGNFVKDILSGFLILALFSLLFSGKWREHLLPLSFMLGYVVVLVFSNFAQSERFHQPAMPMEMMFAAYGISIAVQGIPLKIGIGKRSTYKRWFSYWCVAMMMAAIAWNWFKLAGRGLI